MTPAQELQHIREGAGDAASPGETDVVEAAGGAASLAATREVLEVAVGRAAAGGDWPGVAEWRSLLPAWFVAACVDDAEVRDCVLDKWSLRAWTYWFQPDLRQWRWWDARVEGDRLLVTLLVLQRPYLRGALEWLLKASADARVG
ncbi:MAG TPA: hypothetical protein VOB72_21440 [Candidatus Dormibacteraeota bacterium]|nr:hypothetical protein [Candidatus Dormibacteraeota bacterium]